MTISCSRRLPGKGSARKPASWAGTLACVAMSLQSQTGTAPLRQPLAHHCRVDMVPLQDKHGDTQLTSLVRMQFISVVRKIALSICCLSSAEGNATACICFQSQIRSKGCNCSGLRRFCLLIVDSLINLCSDCYRRYLQKLYNRCKVADTGSTWRARIPRISRACLHIACSFIVSTRDAVRIPWRKLRSQVYRCSIMYQHAAQPLHAAQPRQQAASAPYTAVGTGRLLEKKSEAPVPGSCCH